MEPVQRIPRYTLLFRAMLKHMSPDDPQREKLAEADEIASKIAQAEADEQTKRAAIFYCLIASIEGFPPELFSNSRRFIDCIDVEDIITDAPMSSTSSSTNLSATSLHCTLFLFDDKLVIVKRPGNGEKGGKILSGLDAVEKVTKAGGIPIGKKKSGMTCKGVVDIMDIAVTDIGGAGKRPSSFNWYSILPTACRHQPLFGESSPGSNRTMVRQIISFFVCSYSAFAHQFRPATDRKREAEVPGKFVESTSHLSRSGGAVCRAVC